MSGRALAPGGTTPTHSLPGASAPPLTDTGAAETSPDLESNAVTIAVGPEGGFTDDEVNQAIAAGWLPVDLGPHTLRVETAAIALAAIACVVRRSER